MGGLRCSNHRAPANAAPRPPHHHLTRSNHHLTRSNHHLTRSNDERAPLHAAACATPHRAHQPANQAHRRTPTPPCPIACTGPSHPFQPTARGPHTLHTAPRPTPVTLQRQRPPIVLAGHRTRPARLPLCTTPATLIPGCTTVAPPLLHRVDRAPAAGPAASPLHAAHGTGSRRLLRPRRSAAAPHRVVEPAVARGGAASQ